LGALDEIRVWGKARTEQEINGTEFVRLSGHEQGLLGYWNFDGGTVADLSGSGLGATSTGAPEILSLPGLEVIHRFMRFAVESLTDGRFSTSVQSVSDIPISVEVSNDLKNWQPFVSLTTTGVFEFVDGPTTNFNHRYYRTVSR
jgi:hypothetical protein